jgi:hypothetical protein
MVDMTGGVTGKSPDGVELKFGVAARDSLPPCGGGMAWGVVQWGTAVPHLPTPTPIPSPQGGGEEFAAAANRNFNATLAARHDP